LWGGRRVDFSFTRFVGAGVKFEGYIIKISEERWGGVIGITVLS